MFPGFPSPNCISSEVAANTWNMTIVQHDGDKYLEDGLVVPVGVDLAKLAGDPVVLPHE